MSLRIKAFKVEGIHCAGCAASIKEALERLEGVERASVDVKTGLVTVSYHSHAVEYSNIVEAVERLGYKVAR